MRSSVGEVVEKFRNGDEESAFFNLLEMPGDVLPDLIAAFRNERLPKTRAFLVKAAWERRDPTAVPFLGEALNGAREKVWQEALDGLVTFASPEALEILRLACFP